MSAALAIIIDQNTHVAQVKNLGPLAVPDPEFGDLRLAVFPFTHDGVTPISLPDGFHRWESTLRQMMANVPVQAGATQAFVTIDTKFFATAGLLRREGVHMDGNFCADPTFAPTSWSELVALGDVAQPDNSHVSMGFTLPYDIVVPVGQYVSGSLGGTLVASSYEGCQAWPGTYYGEVGDGGDWSDMVSQLGSSEKITANHLWFLSSNCPHETMQIPQGERRTFVRVTLPHNYDNTVLV